MQVVDRHGKELAVGAEVLDEYQGRAGSITAISSQVVVDLAPKGRLRRGTVYRWINREVSPMRCPTLELLDSKETD